MQHKTLHKMHNKIKVSLSAAICAGIILFACLPMGAAAKGNMNEGDWLRPTGTIYADFLHKLGLFRGTDKGYELEKRLNRDEAAVMLVRLLGKENEALSGEYAMPFDDVDGWARPYVGWLYEMKLANGESKAKFGSKNAVTSQQYLAFLVRCLGYSEAAGDFEYEKILDFAIEKGFFSDWNIANYYRYDYASTSLLWTEYKSLLRFDCTDLSFAALTWPVKQGGAALADALIENGVFTKDAFTDGLWAFAQTYGINKDGHIVRKSFAPAGGVELPWLGISDEAYTEMGWEFGDFFIAFADNGKGGGIPYVIGAESLDKKAKLSDHSIGMVDFVAYNGLLYFMEFEQTTFGESLNFKTYNWEKNEVNDFIRYDAYFTFDSYGEWDGGIKYIVVGKAGENFAYDIIDFSTGAVTHCFTEKAGVISTERILYMPGESRERYSLFICNILPDETRLYIFDSEILKNSLIIPKKPENTEPARIIIDLENTSPPWAAYVNNTIFIIDRYKRMTFVSDFDKGVVWAHCGGDGKVYVLTGKENYGLELGVIGPGGAYTVLVPENIMRSLEASKIKGVSPDGDVTFISEYGVGHTLSDVTTYVYERASGKITATGFTLGRPGLYPDVNEQERLEEIRQKLDELQR